jgi:hypothetical protein
MLPYGGLHGNHISGGTENSENPLKKKKQLTMLAHGGLHGNHISCGIKNLGDYQIRVVDVRVDDLEFEGDLGHGSGLVDGDGDFHVSVGAVALLLVSN